MSTDQQEEIIVNGKMPDDYETLAAKVRQVLIEDPGLSLALQINALQRALDALRMPPGQLYAVTTPDGEEMVIVPVDSMEEMVAGWREVYEKGGQAAGFRGELVLPSKDGQYAVASWGRFPIHAQTHEAEVDPSGRLGAVPIRKPAAPAPVAAPAPAAEPGDDAGDDEDAPYEEVADLDGDDDDFEDEGDDEGVDDETDDD